MKKILFPTDFSAKSKRALRYALQLFQREGIDHDLDVTILHVDNPSPVVHPEVGGYTAVATIISESLKEKQDRLTVITQEWQRIYPKVKFHELVRSGPIVPLIREVAEEAKVELIAVGASGYGPVERAILGSTAVGLSRHAPCPVLVVPEGAVCSGPDKVLFATDFKNLEDVHILDPLKEMVQKIDAQLMLLHIYHDEKGMFKTDANLLDTIDDYFESVKFGYHFLEDRDKLTAIEDFITGYHADILTLVAQERGFFEELFHRSLTRRLIFHSQVPILILHPIFWGPEDVSQEEFDQRVDQQVLSWRSKLDSLIVKSQLGQMEATDQWEKSQDEVRERIRTLKRNLAGAKDVSQVRWKHFQKEMSLAFTHLKKALSGRE